MGDVPAVELNNGVHMPQLGLLRPDDPAAATAAGYRSFAVEATGPAVPHTEVPRHELFIALRLGNAPKAFEEGLRRLGLEYVDLCLLAAPEGDFVQTWKAFEKFAADGRARAIGVCDFVIPNLRRLSEETGTVPAVNQISLSPQQMHGNLRAYHSEHGIVTQARSPLGDLAGDEEVGFMAQKYGKSTAEVVLRWHIELNHAVLIEPGQAGEDIGVFDFELAEDDVLTLSELDPTR